jgi:predicted nucleic acid-binding protein
VGSRRISHGGPARLWISVCLAQCIRIRTPSNNSRSGTCSRTDCSTHPGYYRSCIPPSSRHHNETAADFVASLATTELTLQIPRQEDYSRSAEIIRQYSDAKLDFVDTLIVAMAERLNITRVLTLDRRDFQLIRPKHCSAFEILP